MPGAAESAQRRAQPGALDLIEANSAEHDKQHRKAIVLRRLRRDTRPPGDARQSCISCCLTSAARIAADIRSFHQALHRWATECYNLSDCSK